MRGQGTLTFEAQIGHRRAAEAWIVRHPDAMILFMGFALDAVRAGRRFGIGALTERVRWETMVAWDGEPFKINNNHRAYIARELIRRRPEIAEYVETRKVQG